MADINIYLIFADKTRLKKELRFKKKIVPTAKFFTKRKIFRIQCLYVSFFLVFEITKILDSRMVEGGTKIFAKPSIFCTGPLKKSK